MRTRYRDGELQKDIAASFSTIQNLVSNIVLGTFYKDAPWPPSLPPDAKRKKHPDYPDYEFDSDGNVYSFKYSKRYGRKMRLRPDTEKGYLMVPLRTKNSKKTVFRRVNRLICILFHGPPPTPEHQARHLNGIKTDNRAANLAWGTQKENEDDKKRHGRTARGERVGSAKLTASIVKKIRASKKSAKVLADKYGVTSVHINTIRRRESWKHIQ